MAATTGLAAFLMATGRSSTALICQAIEGYASSRIPALVHLDYSVDRYLCDLISHPLNCTAPDGSITSVTLLDSVEDFSKWKLQGIYVGVETGAKDLRPQSSNPDLQGSISVALQLAALHVLRYPSRPFTPGDCVKLQ